MATSRSPLSNQVQFTNSGLVAYGAKVYFYLAGTTTPLTVYQDSAGSTPHTPGVVASAYGRFPAIYLPFVSYREVVVDANGALISENDNIPNVDPASGASSGGGGNFTPPVGFIFDTFASTTPTGYVPLNGGTIGTPSSSATTRANDDCENLFIHLWNNMSDARAPVVEGRGATAVADWSANKQITLPNLQERVRIGARGMGGTPTSLISSAIIADLTKPGATGGAGSHALTTNELAAHNHPAVVTITDPGHSHVGAKAFTYPNAGGNNVPDPEDIPRSGTTNTATTGITASVSVENAGGGMAHPNVQPSIVVYVYIKL